jgi:aspartate aminotransferase-like enzyme
MPKYRLLTPGPVAVPERVRLAMAQTLLHHRAPAFIPLFREVRANLARVFQTSQDVLVLASSGTGAMEAAVTNTLSPGDRAVVVRAGKFGERWAEICGGPRYRARRRRGGRAVSPRCARSLRAARRARVARQASETRPVSTTRSASCASWSTSARAA